MADLTLGQSATAASPSWRDGTAVFDLRLSRELGLFLAILAFFSALTTVFLWPWLAHLSSALVGPAEDNMNDFWNTWYAVVAADPAHLFHTNLLRFPEGTSLIYQSFAYPQLFSVVALSHVFGTDVHRLVALQNLTLIASFPLAGLGAFYLVRHLTHSTVGALIGGFVFAFSPFHIAQASHHAGVASIEFLPFFVLAFLLALEKRSVAWLVAASICYALSALSCWYYLFYGAYFLAFQLLYLRVRDGAWPRGWLLIAPVLCIAFTLVMLSPLLLPMIAAAGPASYDGGGNTFVADLLGYIAFPPYHFFSATTHWLYARFTGNLWESTVYLGLANVALLLWYWLRNGLGRHTLNFYCAFGMLFFFLLAGGEALHVAGAVTFIHLPDAVLDKLPFFANVRTPSRAALFVTLFMGIGVGAAAVSVWEPRNILSRWLVAALILLIALDFFPVGLQTTSIERSPGLALLRADPEKGFGVLNLPFSYAEEDNYMLEQVHHGRPIVDGVTARSMGVSLLNKLAFADVERQRRQLIRAHVKYILVHHKSGSYYKWNPGLAPLAEYLRIYPTVYNDRLLTILRAY